MENPPPLGYLPGSSNKAMRVRPCRGVAQTNRLPFDRLRANGDMVKSCDFSAHAEFVEA